MADAVKDQKPVEEPAKEEPQKVEVDKDGMTKVPAKVFDDYKTDMHKYKEQRNELQTKLQDTEKQLEDFKAQQKKSEEEKMIENEKFKELAEKREQELVDMQTQLTENNIMSALTVEAMKLKINDVADLKLIDRSKVQINPDTKIVEGIENAIKELKEKKPYLFDNNGTKAPDVDTSKAGDIPEGSTYESLMENPAKLRELKQKDPDAYRQLRNTYIENKGGSL